jgi:hypothetical protein
LVEAVNTAIDPTKDFDHDRDLHRARGVHHLGGGALKSLIRTQIAPGDSDFSSGFRCENDFCERLEFLLCGTLRC